MLVAISPEPGIAHRLIVEARGTDAEELLLRAVHSSGIRWDKWSF
jgi:hypothetical protein